MEVSPCCLCPSWPMVGNPVLRPLTRPTTAPVSAEEVINPQEEDAGRLFGVVLSPVDRDRRLTRPRGQSPPTASAIASSERQQSAARSCSPAGTSDQPHADREDDPPPTVPPPSENSAPRLDLILPEPARPAHRASVAGNLDPVGQGPRNLPIKRSPSGTRLKRPVDRDRHRQLE